MVVVMSILLLIFWYTQQTGIKTKDTAVKENNAVMEKKNTDTPGDRTTVLYGGEKIAGTTTLYVRYNNAGI